MKKIYNAVFVAIFVVQNVLGHKNLPGNCPNNVEPMEEFDMERFLGDWWVQEVFDEEPVCMTWNIAQNTDGYVITEKRESGSLHELGIPQPSGILTPTGDGKFSVKWGALRSSFVVFYTDYDNIAGVFQCNNVFLWHRQQGMILSRKRLLKAKGRQQITGKLRGQGIETHYFKKVDNKYCKDPNRKKIFINYGPLAASNPQAPQPPPSAGNPQGPQPPPPADEGDEGGQSIDREEIDFGLMIDTGLMEDDP